MRSEDFKNPAGELVQITGHEQSTHRDFEHIAFVPRPLPISPESSLATFSRSSDAALALGRLDSAVMKLPNPGLLIRPTLYKEAQSTSALEGTHATLLEVLEGEYLDRGRRSSEVAEVLNYVAAAEAGLQLIRKRPITTSGVAELQGILVKGTRGGSWDAGRVRRTPVYLGGDMRGMENAQFVPVPPGALLQTGLDDWESWINTADDIPLLIKVALSHYQFETLHPFSDGNGRIGRLIVTLQLVAAGVLRQPILNLSSYLEPRKDEYKDLLLACSQRGEFDAWIQFFCRAVEQQAIDEVKRIDQLLDFRQGILDELRSERAKGVVLDIVDDLIAYPVIAPTQAADLHGVTYPPANAAIGRLAKMGHLQEATGRSYGRVFVCSRVMDIVEGHDVEVS